MITWLFHAKTAQGIDVFVVASNKPDDNIQIYIMSAQKRQEVSHCTSIIHAVIVYLDFIPIFFGPLQNTFKHSVTSKKKNHTHACKINIFKDNDLEFTKFLK